MAGGRFTNEGDASTGFVMDTDFTNREGENRDQQIIKIGVRNDADDELLVGVDGIALPVDDAGSTLAANVVSVTNAAGGVAIVPARTTPRAVIIQNHGDKEIWLGPTATLVVGTGYRLLGGDGFTTPPIKTKAAIYGILTGAAQNVSFLEVY